MIFLPDACRGLLGGASGEAVADIKICPQSVIFLPEACRGLLGRDFFEFHVFTKTLLIFYLSSRRLSGALGGASGEAVADIQICCQSVI